MGLFVTAAGGFGGGGGSIGFQGVSQIYIGGDGGKSLHLSVYFKYSGGAFCFLFVFDTVRGVVLECGGCCYNWWWWCGAVHADRDPFGVCF